MLIPFGVLSAAAFAPVSVIGVAGYTAGGSPSGGASYTDAFYRLDFPAETISTLVTVLSIQRYFPAGFSNSNVAGYVAGGQSGPSYTSSVDKLAFPAETRTTLGTGLSLARLGAAGFSDNAVAGYVAGGDTPGGYTTSVDKFAFPGDGRSTLGTGLSSSRGFLAAMSNNAVAGYVAGGGSTGPLSTVDKFAFPSDTRSTLGTGLSTATWFAGLGLSNQGVAGYFNINGSTTYNKFAFATDTRSTFTAVDKNNPSGMNSKSTAGYIAGGQPPTAGTNSVARLSYADDTTTTLAATLPITLSTGTGLSDNGAI
jgi:hypothetical protein